MKFVAISALVAAASAAGGVYDYKVCTMTADCKTTTSKCCMATSTDSSSNSGDYICAPESPTTIPNGVALYAGFTIDCSKTPSVEDGASSLAASVVSVITATYLLA